MTSAATADRRASPLSASMLVQEIARGRTSASDVVKECLARIDELDGTIRAFVDIDADAALTAALSADRLKVSERGPLHGLPVAIKEVFDVKGLRCGWGSPIHRDRVPREDAIAVKRLREAGAIIIGTLVSTEYAIANAGPTVNPHDHSRTPGGSSSGPAAAVASAMVPASLGSQSVGSIVRPAAYCGVFGLKPTRGAIPGRGGMPLSPRLDHPGVFARAAEDLLLLCKALFGRDEQDPTSLAIAPPQRLPELKDLHVLVSRTSPSSAVSAESAQAMEVAVERFQKSGAVIEPFSFGSHYDAVFEVLHTIMTHDMALAHREDRDRHGDLMSAHLRGLIDHGRTVSAAQYEDAVEKAERWRSELGALLGDRAVLVSPATESIAPPIPEGTGSNRPQALWSLVGLPVVSIPCTAHKGLPLAVQVGAGPAREDCVIAIAAHFSAFSHH